MRTFLPLLTLAILLFPPGPLSAGPAPLRSPGCGTAGPGTPSPNLIASRIRQFLDRSRDLPEFNDDRLDFLLKNLAASIRARSSCPSRNEIGPDRIALLARIRAIRDQLRQNRPMTLFSGSALSKEDLRTVGEILDALSPGSSSLAAPPDPSRPRSSPLLLPVRWVVLGALVLGGVLALILSARGFGRSQKLFGREPALPDPRLLQAVRKEGGRWRVARAERAGILERLREEFLPGRDGVRMRAQLLRPLPGKGWAVEDELSDDEGGLRRTFPETPADLEAGESLETIPLEGGELLTRLVVPIPGDHGHTLLVVLDSLTPSPPASRAPDAKTLPGRAEMTEILSLFKERATLDPGMHAGVVSFFFEDPEMKFLLAGTGPDFRKAREFIVRETEKMAGDGAVLIGEPPGYFHILLSGRTDKEAGVLIRTLSEGFLSAAKTAGSGETPWFCKVRIAYTRLRPRKESPDQALARIGDNLAALEKNPGIGPVIDG